MKDTLLIVGAGRLGALVGQSWTGPVTAETRTTRQHDSLRKFGFTPRLRSREGQFDCVLMAVPPSQADHYADEATRALSLWNKKGSFVFVSSTAVYAEEQGGLVTETSALATTDRARLLLEAEAVVLKGGASVVRLAGLYDETSGPHLVYLQTKSSPLRGDGLINLIHRKDAATLILAALGAKKGGAIYLGCEAEPITRIALAEAIAQTTGAKPCAFLGTTGARGKSCHCTWTRQNLNWAPRGDIHQFLKSSHAFTSN